MEIVTDSFNNITISQLYTKLSEKYAQLDKLDQEEFVNNSSNVTGDYYDTSLSSSKYDENDFQRVLDKFKKTDSDIRSHEQIHATIGHTTSPISYNYQQGPDGKMYAVGGSVRLDTSLPKDPEAALTKLDEIKKAASGPADSSGADSMIVNQVNLNKLLIQQGAQDAS